MSLFWKPVQEQARKKDLGVCIPEHVKRGKGTSSAPESKPILVKPATFEVEGTYEIKKTVTLTGTVKWGEITHGSRLIYNGLAIPIVEIARHGRSVEKLSEGESGAITVEPDFTLWIDTNSKAEFG